MSYNYAAERPWLFTEDGQVALFQTLERARSLLSVAGAFNGMKALERVSVGDTFKMMALLDRLVELRALREVTAADCRGQDRIFVAGEGA